MTRQNSQNYFRFNNLLLGYLLKEVLAQQIIYFSTYFYLYFCVEIETWKDESNKWNIAFEKVKLQ